MLGAVDGESAWEASVRIESNVCPNRMLYGAAEAGVARLGSARGASGDAGRPGEASEFVAPYCRRLSDAAGEFDRRLHTVCSGDDAVGSGTPLFPFRRAAEGRRK